MPTERRKKADQERKERTRGILMEAACRVFIHRGYHATLISDIVAEAGVGQGTFYRFFPNKRAIFQSLFDQFVELLLIEFRDFSSHLPSNYQEYRRASVRSISQVAHILLENREMARFFMRQAPVIDPEFELHFNAAVDAFAGLARGYLEHAIQCGFARACDARIVSQCLVGIARHLITTMLDRATSATEVQEVLSEVLDFAFLGIGPALQPGNSADQTGGKSS